MAATKNCIICFQTANGFGGHVHKGEERIIAGWCSEHFSSSDIDQNTGKPFNNPPIINGCKGCYGEWKNEMDIDESFGRLMYIDTEGLHDIDEEKNEDDETTNN